MAKTAIEGAERGTTFRVDPEKLVIIGRDTNDGPEHPLYQKARALREPDENIVQGIMEMGVIVPITARKNKDKGDRIEVIDGRGRVIDAREANKRLIARGDRPKLVEVTLQNRKTSDIGAVVMVSNMHRLDVDLWTVAEDCAQQQAAGHSLETIALWCKRSGPDGAQWVADTIKILDVIPEIRVEIQAGTIPRTAAVKLAKLTSEEQREALANMVAALVKPSDDDDRPPTPRADGSVLPLASDKRGSGVVKAGLNAATAAKKKGGRKAPGRPPAPEPKYTPPNRTMIKKLAALSATQRTECGMSDSVYAVLRWAIGERAASSVPGLVSALREAGVVAIEVE